MSKGWVTISSSSRTGKNKKEKKEEEEAADSFVEVPLKVWYDNMYEVDQDVYKALEYSHPKLLKANQVLMLTRGYTFNDIQETLDGEALEPYVEEVKPKWYGLRRIKK